MTVKELAEILGTFPPDLEVRLADESGDFRAGVSVVRIKATINEAGGDGPEAACLIAESAT